MSDTLIACARCASKAESRRVLERHLVEHHLLAAAAAQVEAELSARSCPGCGRSSGAHNKACPARRTWTPPAVTGPITPAAAPAPSEPPASKEIPMAKSPCSYCKRTDGTHAEACRRTEGCKLCAKRPAGEKCPYHGGQVKTSGPNGHKRAKKPKSAAKAPRVREALSLNGDNSARKAAEHLVDQLHRLRARLEEKIAEVQELVEIL